jgi:hypothetical protein
MADKLRSSPGSQGENAAVLERLGPAYRELKSDLKTGRINYEKTLPPTRELHKFLNANVASFGGSDESQYIYFHTRSVTSELFDRFDCIGEATEASSEAKAFIDQLRKEGDNFRPEGSRRILREKVRLSLNYAQARYYRSHKYEAAKKVVDGCQHFIERFLKDEESFPCHGSLAQCLWLGGKIARQEGRYEEAEWSFLRSEIHHRQRVESKRKQAGASSLAGGSVSEDLTFSTYRTGIIRGLGHGWMNVARGHLRRALHDIIPARTMLLHAEDELNNAYLDLIEASIWRSLSPRGGPGFEVAIGMADSALEVFRRNKHSRYAARAAFELGLTYLLSGKLEEAEQKASDVKKASVKANDSRWICNSNILLSRISRVKGDSASALQLATEAIALANVHTQTLCHVKGLMARGEAKIELNDMDGAREDLHQALDLNARLDKRTGGRGRPKRRETICYLSKGVRTDLYQTLIRSGTASGQEGAGPTNLRINAICYLNIARSYAREHLKGKALEYFQHWKQVEREVEHRYVRDLADDVLKEIGLLEQDLVIVAGTADLNYKAYEKKLRTFLIKQAKEKGLSTKGAAEALGISRQTLYEWEASLAGETD